jgi:protein involved in polysaccharide export with SLBB domain
MGKVLAAIALILWAGIARAEEYALGPQDVLTVRVGHWDLTEGVYVPWDGMNGEYVVGPDGTVQLPMAGPVMAAGQTQEGIRAAIADALRARVATRDEVEVSVEISGFRSVYVLGAVRSPGAYPFTPGLTVLQAIGLAGGLAQSGMEYQRNERSALASLGNYEVMKLNLWRAIAREARLVAESEELDGVETPPELGEAELADELMAREREIFAARRAALESALSQLDELETLLVGQIDQLSEQTALRARQLELADEELANITDLVERGLTTAARRIELESRVADQEIRLLELATARLNAEQRLNETGRERADLVNARAREVAEELLAVRGEIEEIRIRMRTEAALYAEATQYEDGYVRPEGIGAPVLELTRGEAAPILVARSDLMQPGDVLELVVPLPGVEEGSGAPLLRDMP